uniref:F0F1 ATP synthase subunit B n=1 Tax=Desulforadius tongensis TaxID=1216062 RepID=UPI001EE52DCA|nr:F0F1 ATP synthase subunit B [Desulforadius tongensis]
MQAIEVARSAAEGGGPLLFNATLLAQIFHFVILLIFLRVVVWKPLIGVIEKRKEKIGSDIAAAEKDRREAEKLRAELDAQLAKAKEEAQAIIQRATKSAEEEAAKIVESAKSEATRIKESALQDIQMEREKAVAELKNEVASLSILIANKVVSEKITDDVQDDLVKKFIDEAGKLPC